MPRKSEECLTKKERILNVLLAFNDEKYFPDILKWLESLPNETFINEAYAVDRHLKAVLMIRDISVNAANIESNRIAIQTGSDRGETLDERGINYKKSHTVLAIRSIHETLCELTDPNNQDTPSWTKVQKALAVTPYEIGIWVQSRHSLTSAVEIFEERESLGTKSRTPDAQLAVQEAQDLLYSRGVEIAINSIDVLVDHYRPQPES